MSRRNLFQNWLGKAFVVALLVLAIVLLAGVARARGKGEQLPASWEYTIDSSQTTLQTAAQLDNLGVKTDVQAFAVSKNLVLSGNQGTDQIRQVLYSPLLDGFINGPAEVEINLPVSASQTVAVSLQANITTGSTWRLVPGTSFTQLGKPAFSQSSGYGATSVETLILLPGTTGNAIIKLNYGRSFGSTRAATRHVRLNLTSQAAVIDLSNPAPVFNKKLTLTDNPLVVEEQGEQAVQPASLPASLDWRTAGIVPAVRDQGNWGSCWAFGTVGVMESAIKKAGGPMTDLSEQFLVSCNTSGWDAIDGGFTAHYWHYNTLGKKQTTIGAVYEANMPYDPAHSTCKLIAQHPYKLAGWAFITGSEDTMPTVSQLKSALYTYGPVTAGVCADDGWDYYAGGVYNPTSNQCGGSTNHQIIIVGWEDSTSSWIVRNSWSSDWGENGYMRIKWDPTGKTSRIGEGTSWVRWAKVATVPTIKAPVGVTTDRTPTYSWTKVSGATQYRYRVVNAASALVYTKLVPASACAAGVCSNTPITALGYKSYKWQVQALIGGVWKAYSPYKAFTVSQ